jgi:hypothetical protein
MAKEGTCQEEILSAISMKFWDFNEIEGGTENCRNAVTLVAPKYKWAASGGAGGGGLCQDLQAYPA